MKWNITKTIVGVVLMSASIAFGNADGREQLEKIKASQYVVTQEVDSVFTSWTNGNQVVFKADTNNFFIGGLPLSSLLGLGNETDPFFKGFKNSANSISIGSGTSASF